MILTSALVLLAASAFQAPAPEPTKTSVLPSDCGLTEKQVIDLAFPGYRADRTDPSKQDDPADLDFYQAKIVDALMTSFGRGFGSFVVAVVDITTNCDFCQKTTLVVIDKATHELVWRLAAEGISRPQENKKALRTVRLFPDDPVLTLVFRSDSIGCTGGCGAMEFDEHWLHPRLTEESSLVFDTVWEGAVASSTAGRRGGTWSRACSSIQSLWPRRAYRLRRWVEAGWLPKPDRENPVASPCGGTDWSFGSVVFEFEQDMEQNGTAPALSLAGNGTWQRWDRRPTVTFPFNLKANRLLYDGELPAPREPSRRMDVPSPGGAIAFRRTPRAPGALEGGVELIRPRDGQVLRTIPDATWVNDAERRNEYFGYRFLAIGWSAGGTRALAIIETELIGLPPVLVSLSPDGSDDRWEGLLASAAKVPGDGFILDLPEPAAEPTKHSTKR